MTHLVDTPNLQLDAEDLSGLGAARQLVVLISSEDIKELNSSPKVLIDAPGEGNVIMVQGYFAVYTKGAVAYTGAGSFPGTNGLYVGGDPNTEALFGLSDLFESVGSAISFGPGDTSGGGGKIALTDAENLAVVLKADGSDYEDGDGTAILTIWYRIMSLTTGLAV